jgi:hypothetical protein
MNLEELKKIAERVDEIYEEIKKKGGFKLDNGAEIVILENGKYAINIKNANLRERALMGLGVLDTIVTILNIQKFCLNETIYHLRRLQYGNPKLVIEYENKIYDKLINYVREIVSDINDKDFQVLAGKVSCHLVIVLIALLRVIDDVINEYVDMNEKGMIVTLYVDSTNQRKEEDYVR